MPVYLDCNATTPVDPRVRDEVVRFMDLEFGNAGSRTHQFGQRAKQAVQRARDQVALVVDASPEEIVFTSGATESDNLAILGLRTFGERTGRKHIVTTAIEHKAVLEPLSYLGAHGFEITLVPPSSAGSIEPRNLLNALRKDTLLVSVMHVNNETGVVQPIKEVCESLSEHPAYLHVDAAQGFGKDIDSLRNRRVDLMSVSGHKIYAPKGIGALVTRRRGYDRPPLEPLMYGGGQERGLRAGTLPVPLIVGLGIAAELALKEHAQREEFCRNYRNTILQALSPLNPTFNGDSARTLPHVLNISFSGLDSEAVMLALKDIVAISNGSACTSQNYSPSHVLTAMGLPEDLVRGALRISWCHMTDAVDWDHVRIAIKGLY
jgi:cysteine desulfurase